MWRTRGRGFNRYVLFDVWSLGGVSTMGRMRVSLVFKEEGEKRKTNPPQNRMTTCILRKDPQESSFYLLLEAFSAAGTTQRDLQLSSSSSTVHQIIVGSGARIFEQWCRILKVVGGTLRYELHGVHPFGFEHPRF